MDLGRLCGIFTPTLTPLTTDERIDEASLRRLLAFLLAEGVHGIWVMGTTGEFAALPVGERARAVQLTVETVGGRVPVVANVGDGSTTLALEHARQAVLAGVDALALTPPYYYPHSMDEMLGHFRRVKQAFPETPLLVYNIPQTVKVRMALSTTLELAREGTTDGIKDSQNDLVWFRNLADEIQASGLSERFRMFLGTRTLIDAAVQIGAHGAIPATSNIAPRACVDAYELACRGDHAGAEQAQRLVMRFENLSQLARGGSETAASLGTMKQVLARWGIIENPTLTKPLREMLGEEVTVLRDALERLPRPAGLAAA